MRIHKSPEYVKFLNNKIYKEYGIINSIFYSKSYGKFKVLKEIGKDKKSNKLYEIIFILTKYRMITKKSCILDGSVMDPMYDEDISIGSIYDSNNYGKFKIKEFCGRANYSEKLYKIQFLNTGYELISRKRNILNGSVKDHKFDDMIDKIYSSNKFGSLIVDKCVGRNSIGAKMYQVTFLDTGYETISTKNHILNGDIYDPIKPIIFGKGCLGKGYEDIRSRDKDLYTAMYGRWYGMLRRCYDEKHDSYSTYGKIGINVDLRWHTFCNFYNDIILLPNFDRNKFISGKLVIDKDKKQIDIPYNKRIYSKDTVSLLTQSENDKYRNTDKMSVYFISIDKDGNEVLHKNISKFAKLNNFKSASSITNILHKNCGYTKTGYTFRYPTEEEISQIKSGKLKPEDSLNKIN